jgi:ABC-type antimicrobial peptide transport system permease subunit
MGNLLLFWSVVFVFRRRPESRKWLIRTALLKITGVALGLVMYVFFAGGAVLAMLRELEAAHAAVYAERGLPVPEEFLLAPSVFFWVFVLFVAVMLVWPVLTIFIQRRRG